MSILAIATISPANSLSLHFLKNVSFHNIIQKDIAIYNNSQLIRYYRCSKISHVTSRLFCALTRALVGVGIDGTLKERLRVGLPSLHPCGKTSSLNLFVILLYPRGCKFGKQLIASKYGSLLQVYCLGAQLLE